MSTKQHDETEVCDAGFTAADMATAAAQGFRDGQAAQQAPAGAALRSMIEGMSVSVDVSTGDHDAGHRYFGTVTEVMECKGDKHGVTLLVQDAEPNFAAPAAPSTPASGGWISVDERLPEVGVTVLVYEPFRHGEDWPDTVRIFFDYICPDYEGWHNHCESYEHFMVIGGSGACGPDVTCTGPSEKAPYTHWMPLPGVPVSPTIEGESNG